VKVTRLVAVLLCLDKMMDLKIETKSGNRKNGKRASFHNPLIYYTCFGPDAQFESLRQSLLSLIEFGNYYGDICIITDRQSLDTWLPEGLPGTVHIVVRNSVNTAEYRCQRYQISDVEIMAAYGPILFLDTDVRIVSSVSEVLRSIASSERVCAGMTRQASLRKKVLPLQAEAAGRFTWGINTAVIGFASVRVAKRSFDQIVTTLQTMASVQDWLFFVDQIVASHVLQQTNALDETTLSSFIQTEISSHTINTGPVNTNFVFVHLWATPPQIEAVAPLQPDAPIELVAPELVDQEL